jgi:outer membrane PBP1 activator LpoA protein
MRIALAVFLIFLAACTQVSTRKSVEETEISPVAKGKLSEARDLIKANNLKSAVAKLSELNDNSLTPIEKALKYNLKGVILFNMNEVDKAILNFEVAEKYSPKDTQLFSQVQLNMASGHFKLNQFTEMRTRLNNIELKNLTDVEKKKYAQLELAYGKKFENPKMVVTSSLIILSELRTFAEIQNSNLYEPMKENFKKLTPGQRVELLEEWNDTDNLPVANLAQIEADERYMNGDKAGAKDVVAWLKSEFATNEEVAKFVREFEMRMENSGRISMNAIGLVLPLTGDKGTFGQKALSGVDTGLKVLGMGDAVKIFTKDSLDSPAQGAQAVLDLIREEKVSFIIGGLFPDSAKAEYLEARKYGVLYISLSQINLPKEEKNHHLIEIQGSIESQVETLMADGMIQKFGTRMGIIYPDNEGGKAYADEIWRKANQKNVSITSIATFPKNTHDYRDTAQLFLGLKYPRERSEELAIVDDVYALEKSSIRRVQTLPPMLDFDWVFLATYPHEAIGLIPTLGYYDANRIKVVGGPSWVSKSLVKEQKNMGTLYFIGEDPKDINQEMLNKFQEIYGKPAGLIEILALDAMKIGAETLIASGEVTSRDEFDAKIKGSVLKGLTTTWAFKDGVWLKDMKSMTITRGEIVKMFGENGVN